MKTIKNSKILATLGTFFLNDSVDEMMKLEKFWEGKIKEEIKSILERLLLIDYELFEKLCKDEVVKYSRLFEIDSSWFSSMRDSLSKVDVHMFIPIGFMDLISEKDFNRLKDLLNEKSADVSLMSKKSSDKKIRFQKLIDLLKDEKEIPEDLQKEFNKYIQMMGEIKRDLEIELNEKDTILSELNERIKREA